MSGAMSAAGLARRLARSGAMSGVVWRGRGAGLARSGFQALGLARSGAMALVWRGLARWGFGLARSGAMSVESRARFCEKKKHEPQPSSS